NRAIETAALKIESDPFNHSSNKNLLTIDREIAEKTRIRFNRRIENLPDQFTKRCPKSAEKFFDAIGIHSGIMLIDMIIVNIFPALEIRFLLRQFDHFFQKWRKRRKIVFLSRLRPGM